MNIQPFIALGFAALQSLSLWKKWSRLEYFSKPAVMVVLFIWLWTATGLKGAGLWFGLGILFSLVGDLFLMIAPVRMFLPGLIAFLLAHIAYVIGFNTPLPPFSGWGIFLAVMIGLSGARIIRRILGPLAAKGLRRMRFPIVAYGAAISLMVLSALMKLTDVSWSAGAALLVGFGAFMFYISDIILAWNKFVSPIRYGRIYNIAVYHLGQIALIAGVVLHLG